MPRRSDVDSSASWLAVLIRSRHARRAGVVVAVVLLAAIVAFALLKLNLAHVGHAVVSASPGWIALALVLMTLSLFSRAASWHETLCAALPDVQVGWMAVVRATMIGVMGSAVFPGRIGEPARVFALSRRLEGSTRTRLPVVAGTVFSQTIINLGALAVLAAVTFSSVPLLHGHGSALLGALALPAIVVAAVLIGPALLRVALRSRSVRLRLAAAAVARLLRLARRGLVVFARPRHGATAITAQLLAWTLQWLSCYMVILALGLQSKAGPVAAAAILLAVNLSAVLPATPSNVGVFQAACLVVLAAYGVGAGPAFAYGIILQAVEVLTALGLGVPALLGEGMSWRDIRGAAAEEQRAVGVEQSTEKLS
jgi:phosphatidyl-myo-inositol alpha-mannosyltransferase